MIWTKEDTAWLNGLARCEFCASCEYPMEDDSARLTRAVAHIKALEARVAELGVDNEALQSHVAMRTEILAMAERADTIPRAVLVRALRDRAKGCPDQDWPESTRDELEQVADEIERGEWPQTQKGETE